MLVSGLAHRLVDRDHGADRVLAKPFDIDVLLEQVEYLASCTRDGVAQHGGYPSRRLDRRCLLAERSVSGSPR